MLVSSQTSNFLPTLRQKPLKTTKIICAPHATVSRTYSTKELKKKVKEHGDRHVKGNDVYYSVTMTHCSPLCFVTLGHQPLRQAHWLSASARLLLDTP